MLFLLLLLSVGLTSGKIYDRCELARELKFVHEAPSHQLATWVCIAEHESQYNTSIVGHLNGDGSGDHGIFQISDKFWCSPPGKGYACGVTCAELEDDDISDDYLCAQRIYKEHKTLSGDGFNAWAVYTPHCKGSKAEKYIKNCFDDTDGSNEVAPDRPEPPAVFAHGFFGTAAGRSKPFTTSTETPFDAFFTPTTSFVAPTAKTSFLASSVFIPSTDRPATSSVFVPSTRPSFIIYNPTVSTFASLPSRSSIFGSSRFFTPTTSSFVSTTPRTFTQTPVPREPVFVFNGVKWY